MRIAGIAALSLALAIVSASGQEPIYSSADTQPSKALIGKFAGNVLRDQKAIWTSPFQAENAGWWLGVGAVTAVLIATDNHTITAFENSRGQVRWGNNISRIGASYTLLPIVGGLYAFGFAANDSKARETGVLGAEALLDSLIVVEVLKPIARRVRPDGGVEHGEFFDGGSSFPSGHAIESWALASVIAHEYADHKFVPVLAYGLASVVSAARFTAQKHYASDIVAGGVMGWFIGHYVYQSRRDPALDRHAWLRPRLTPMLRPAAGTYGIALNFGH